MEEGEELDRLTQLVEDTAEDITEWCGLEPFEKEGIKDRLWQFLQTAQRIQ